MSEITYRRYFFIKPDRFLTEEKPPSKDLICDLMGMHPQRFDECITVKEDGTYQLDLKKFGIAEFVAFVTMFTDIDWVNASVSWVRARPQTRKDYVSGMIFGKAVKRIRRILNIDGRDSDGTEGSS